MFSLARRGITTTIVDRLLGVSLVEQRTEGTSQNGQKLDITYSVIKLVVPGAGATMETVQCKWGLFISQSAVRKSMRDQQWQI